MQIKKEKLHCYYSGLPSPLAYDTDYDGMGNQGRFLKNSEKKSKSFISKLKEIFHANKKRY